MQLTALRYFHETARLGSIRKAAEALSVTPSAISRQIANLEHDLRAPLFERSVHGMRLTAAGDLLARQTHRTFLDLDRVRSSVDVLRALR
jgi:DNA-binding transcriptional LysR family regulator